MYQQLVLNDFVFSVGNGTAYDRLVRKSTGGFVKVDRLNAKPRSQNTGQGPETINLNVKVFGNDGTAAIARLRALQNTREPQLLVDSSGSNLGFWEISEITETQENVIDDGSALSSVCDLLLEEFIGETS